MDASVRSVRRPQLFFADQLSQRGFNDRGVVLNPLTQKPPFRDAFERVLSHWFFGKVRQYAFLYCDRAF